MFSQFIDLRIPEINFIIRERLDPFILSFFKFFSLQPTLKNYILFQLVILFFGLLYVFRLLKIRKSETFLLASTVTISIVFMIGLEPSYLKFHWFPFLLGSFLLVRRRMTPLNIFFHILFVLLWSLTAGALAIFGGLMAVVLGGTLFSSKEHTLVDAHQGQFLQKACILGSAFLLFTLGTFLMPLYAMPQYPPGARLVPVSAYTFLPYPLIGPFLEPNPLLYSGVMEYLRCSIIRFLIVSIVLFLALRSKVGLAKGIFLLSSLAFLVVTLEVLVPETFAAWTPFQSMVRLIPGLSLEALPWIILPFATIAAVVEERKRQLQNGSEFMVRLLPIAFFFVLFSVDSIFFPGNFLKGFPKPVNHFRRYEESISSNFEKKLLVSPSGFILDQHGSWVSRKNLKKARDIINLEEISRKDWQVTASPLPEEALFAVDNDLHTRWRTGRAQQSGDYFSLTLPQASSVVKAVLAIPAHYTDFPRGITVQGSRNGNEYYTLFSELRWGGALEWTKNGYPYYGLETNVVLEFSPNQKTKYLRFLQTENATPCDWSIDELHLYRKPRQKIQQ